MNFIAGQKIFEALSKSYRVYLCGDLKSPQSDLQWIDDKQLEIGISYYNQFSADKPHFHKNATEYNYVLKGTTKLFIIDENQEYTFDSGSLFVIPPNLKYATKHVEDTQILFIKAPGGNDKQLIDISTDLEAWLQMW